MHHALGQRTRELEAVRRGLAVDTDRPASLLLSEARALVAPALLAAGYLADGAGAFFRARRALELAPILGYPPFEELVKPKG